MTAYDLMQNTRISNILKISYDKLQIACNNNNLVLLTNFSDYRGLNYKIDYLCKKHNNITNTFASNLLKIKGCRLCGAERSHKFLDFNIVIKLFESFNYILLSKKEDYSGFHCNLKYLCPKHLDRGILEVSCSNLTWNKGCRWCGIDNKSKENCYCWKGGISSITNYLRGVPEVIDWKNKSIKSCYGRCLITGEPFEEVHHLDSIHKYIMLSHEENDILVKSEINKYTLNELLMLEHTFVNYHKKQPLGACLTHKIHKLYHRLYGNENNEAQFHEFFSYYRKKPL